MKESDVIGLLKALEDELGRYGASEELRIAILETVNNWYPGVMFNDVRPNDTVPDDEVDTEMVANKKRCATCIEYVHEETLNSDEGCCWHMSKLIFDNDGDTIRPVVKAYKNYCDHWKDVGGHE